MPQRPDEPGDPLVFSGAVTTPDGEPIVGALPDVWHSDATVPGTYSNIHPGQPAFQPPAASCGPTTKASSSSRRFQLPAPYPIPDQGPTGRLLNALGRHSWRPAHIHVKVSADGYQPLTTQLYFRGDEFLDSDAASAVKDQLIVPLEPAGKRARGPHLTLRYDFQLAPAVRWTPEASSFAYE